MRLRRYLLPLALFSVIACNSCSDDDKAVVLSESKQEVINKLLDNMVTIEGGTFDMGSVKYMSIYPDEFPIRSIKISTFKLCRYEVTQAEWKAIMGKNPSLLDIGDNKPVVQVSWYDCKEFIAKLNKATGKKFRLATEAEWEYAARGGIYNSGSEYAGADSLNINAIAWFKGNSNGILFNVGGKRANQLGLHDMSGNVWEWCEDWYISYEPLNVGGYKSRVFRGGAYNMPLHTCRVAFRCGGLPELSEDNIGLRLAMSE